jgi:uncharacterized membrane protein YdjX (TVP38/TMEM64 family)
MVIVEVNSNMKEYLKVLLITLSLQITGFISMKVLSEKFHSDISFMVFAISIIVSTFIGIIMPIVICKSLKSKLLTIFLLPTNYTWLLAIVVVILFVSSVLDVLQNFPKNF